MGYDRDSPAYLVYCSETRTVSKHRLVTFTEKFKTDDDGGDMVITLSNESDQDETPVEKLHYLQSNHVISRNRNDFDK